MSDLFPLFDDAEGDDAAGGGPGGGDGRRSVWTVLSVLAFALIVVVVAAFLLRSSPSTHQPNQQLAGPTGPGSTTAAPSVGDTATQSESPSPTQSHQSTSPHPSTSASSPTASKSATPTPSKSTSSSKSATPTPTPTPSTSTSTNIYAPCTSPAPCIVLGDNGGVAALEAYLKPPTGARQQGSISRGAEQCALQEATPTPCLGAHAYTFVATENGPAAIKAIVGSPPSWFGDANFNTFELGWAYWPQHGYICEVLKN